MKTIRLKKLIVGGIGILLVLFILCPSSADAAPEKISLKVWSFGARLAELWKNYAPDFEKLHPNVSISVTRLPSGPMMDKLQICFRTGVGAPDIADVEPCGRFLAGPLDKLPLLDLTSYVEKENLVERCLKGTWERGSYKGRYFYAPWDETATVLIYRRDIFEEAGFPSEPEEVEKFLATWDDYIKAGKKITKDIDGDGKIDRYMMMADYKTSWAGSREFQTVFTQRGGSWFDKEGQQLVDSRTMIDAVRFYVDLLNKHKIVMDIGADVKAGVRFTAINKDEVATAIVWGWYAAWVKDYTPALEEKWGAVLIPAVKPEGRRTGAWPGPGVACIIKQSKHPDIAWKYMNFCMFNKENLLRRYREGWWFSLPPVKEVLKDAMYSKYDPYWKQRFGAKMVESMIKEDLPIQYHSPYMKPAWEYVGAAINEVAYGGKTPEEAIKDAADKLRTLMK